jgi:polysaccharide biosynthesis/export protein
MNHRSLILLLIIISITSCTPYKDMVLFRRAETPLTDLQPLSNYAKPELTIQNDDALYIVVSCYCKPELIAPFNLVNPIVASNVQASSPVASFLVDNKGEIDFPVLGKLQVARKTIAQVKDTLYKKIKPYITDPSLTINIRRVNFRITVMGEVNKAGTFNINSERVTLLEALGMAGDLTAYSDRERITIIREVNGKTTYGKVNMQTSDFISSPYFYLYQNDVVYVDPKKSKRAVVQEPADKYLARGSAILAGISTFVTFLIFFKD